ncbi:glycosyltransferase [Acetobacteraceae bacterium]|nr:glycosyltransferase [Acetobacteraceae bacterium]
MSLSSRLYSCAVVIPCLNEELALPLVIKGLQTSLPQAQIWVYDNGSTDNTILVAKSLGAKVRSVPLKGKGYAILQAFADLSTDYLFIIDGDATYETAAAPRLLNLAMEQNLDMVTAIRRAIIDEKAYRFGHLFGNKVLTGLVRKFFSGLTPHDLLSGYRVFSKRFYKSFPCIISGFEIETYLTLHALTLAMPTGEMDTIYQERPSGSESKLRTYPDGLRILKAIIILIQRERPLFAYCWISLFIGFIGLILGLSLIPEYLTTGLVPRFPTAILSTALILFSLITATCGVLLHNIASLRRENIRLTYMQNHLDD